MFQGNVEELINSLEKAIPESLKYLLHLALTGSQPPLNQTSLPGGRQPSAPTTKKTPTPDFKTQGFIH